MGSLGRDIDGSGVSLLFFNDVRIVNSFDINMIRWKALVLLCLFELLSPSSSGPSACELAIVRCCSSKQGGSLPVRCFEVNNCAGLYWQGLKACSPKNVEAALKSVESKKPKPIPEKPTKAPARPPSKSRPNKKLPTECLLAIVRCCDPNQSAFLPFRCFEVNRCPGLYWVRSRVCSSRVVKMATKALVP